MKEQSYSAEQISRALRLVLGTGYLRFSLGVDPKGGRALLIGMSNVQCPAGSGCPDVGEPEVVLDVPPTQEAVESCLLLAEILTELAGLVVGDIEVTK
jgi:hypothetical protein